MKIALIAMIDIKIIKKCSGALRWIIERVIVKTTGRINSGVKFLLAFRRLIIPKTSNGIITIAKKWVSKSPTKNIRNAVRLDTETNTIELILLGLIFKIYTTPPRTGINPIYGIYGIKDEFTLLSKPKRFFGMLENSL